MTKVTADVYKQYQELEVRLSDALEKNDGNATTQVLAELEQWKTANNVDLTQPVEPDTPTPDPGHVKTGGWGANTDATKWKVVPMKQPTTLWKIVDENDKNVADQFMTQAGAQAYIDAHKGSGPPPPPPPSTGGTDQFGIKKIHPDKPGGRFETNFTGREFERHYASGKPSENSYEYNQKASDSAKNSDVEVTFYEKINGFKTNEPDTISVKLTGPDHQDGACCWVIPEWMTDGSDKKTLETEKPHPQNHGVNPKPLSPIGGSLVGQWVGIKGITYVKNGHRQVESWIHFPVSNIDNVAAEQDKWRQYIPTTQVSDDYLKANGVNTLNRLDGTKKGDPPTFKFASVREIQV